MLGYAIANPTYSGLPLQWSATTIVKKILQQAQSDGLNLG